jgi:uncharacterized glyoxalase superfamily protein PhnB
MTPVLRYRNPGAAARWLCEAFGFQEHESAQESDRHVKYILLRLADSCVLVRPVASSVFDDLMVEPSAIGGGNTHVLYVPVPDAELHCARAQAAGAKIELEPQDDGLGGRFYSCRDPEGHLWSFGTKTYGMASLARTATPVHGVPAPAKAPGTSERVRAGLLARAGAALTLLAALSAGWLLYEAYTQGAFQAGSALTTGGVEHGPGEQPAAEVSRRLAAQAPAEDTAALLGQEQTRRRAAEAAAAEAAAKLAEEQALRAAAETRGTAAEAKLAQMSAGAAEARQATQSLETDAARERRQTKEALTALERRLADEVAANARAKENAAKALLSAEQALRDEKAVSARAQAEREALEAEAARAQARQAAAAIAAGAEAATLHRDMAQLEQERARQASELEVAYATLNAARAEIDTLRAAQQEAKREPTPEVVAASRQQLAQLEGERARQGAELEAAYTALNAIRGEIEALRAALREAKRETRGEPTPQVAAAEPQPVAAETASPATLPRPSTPCAQAVQGKLRLGPKGPRAWPEGSLARLCHGAETSVEPARCFDELMRGKISWGTGSTWTASNALILCAGTKSARQTLDCFATSIAGNETWASAINACRLAKP